MKNNKKAMLLDEFCVLIICSMIFFIAVSNVLENRSRLVKRLTENNNVLMIMESITDKIRSDIKSGISIDELDLSEYEEIFNVDGYKIKLRRDTNKIDVLLAVFYKSDFGSVSLSKVKRIYKKEVLLNEE